MAHGNDSRVSPATRRTYLQCPGGHVSERVVVDIRGNEVFWKCGKCGLINRYFDNHACQFVPFYHEHLGHEPVYVDSWKSFRRELASIGAHNQLAD